MSHLSNPAVIVALIAAFAAIAVQTIAVAGGFIVAYKKLGEIHVLVNSRMTEALEEISTLRELLGLPPRIEKK